MTWKELIEEAEHKKKYFLLFKQDILKDVKTRENERFKHLKDQMQIVKSFATHIKLVRAMKFVFEEGVKLREKRLFVFDDSIWIYWNQFLAHRLLKNFGQT